MIALMLVSSSKLIHSITKVHLNVSKCLLHVNFVADGEHQPERDDSFGYRDGQESVQRTSTPVNTQRSMNVHLLFNECSVALLEDPATGESTSPGLCVEVCS